jgi:YVTN family beta-propeller protein
MIYVPNETLDTLTVISGTSNQVVANIPLGGEPYAAAVNPVTNLIYVTIPGSSVLVIDGTTNTVSSIIAPPSSTPPFAIAVNPITNLIYFVSFSCCETSVSVIDGVNNQIVKNLPLTGGYYATALAVNTTTDRIFVAFDFSPQQVVVIDGKTNDFEMFTVPGLCNLVAIAVDSSLNRIYAPDDECGGLYIISGANDKLVTTVLPLGVGPVAVSPTSHQIADFSLGELNFTLNFLSGQTDSVVGGIVNLPVSQQPLSIAANDENRYFVSSAKSKGIVVISGPTP